MLEAEQERWFLWVPVLLGSGIGIYFALPSEPYIMPALRRSSSCSRFFPFCRGIWA
jgi:hypothetical protein